MQLGPQLPAKLADDNNSIRENWFKAPQKKDLTELA